MEIALSVVLLGVGATIFLRTALAANSTSVLAKQTMLMTSMIDNLEEGMRASRFETDGANAGRPYPGSVLAPFVTVGPNPWVWTNRSVNMTDPMTGALLPVTTSTYWQSIFDDGRLKQATVKIALTAPVAKAAGQGSSAALASQDARMERTITISF